MNKQTEATNHIKQLLSNSGLNLQPKKLTLPDNQQWNFFEHNGKQVGIDTASGVWIRSSVDEDWRCIGLPCTVSCAIQAVDFLCG